MIGLIIAWYIREGKAACHAIAFSDGGQNSQRKNFCARIYEELSVLASHARHRELLRRGGRFSGRFILIPPLYNQGYIMDFFRLTQTEFKAVNPIILFDFKMLRFFGLAKKAEVQNFEPHPIVKIRFKNNRFFDSSIYSVKNYEPNR